MGLSPCTPNSGGEHSAGVHDGTAASLCSHAFMFFFRYNRPTIRHNDSFTYTIYNVHTRVESTIKSKQPPVEVSAAVGVWHGSTTPLLSSSQPRSLHITTRPSPWHSRDTDRGKRRGPRPPSLPPPPLCPARPPRGYTPDLPLNDVPPSYNRFPFSLPSKKATSVMVSTGDYESLDPSSILGLPSYPAPLV